MKKIKVNFANCFGIKKMEETFDFSNSNVQLIYAKNGSMKTSFAKIFEKYQNVIQGEIQDLACGKETKYDIKIDTNNINTNEIFVIKPFEKEYEKKTD